MQQRKKLFVLLMLLSLFQTSAFAGVGGSVDPTFDSLVTLMTSYLTGSFGLGISLASVILGAITALYTKTLMFLGFGIGLAIGLVYIPDILTSFFTATL